MAETGNRRLAMLNGLAAVTNPTSLDGGSIPSTGDVMIEHGSG